MKKNVFFFLGLILIAIAALTVVAVTKKEARAIYHNEFFGVALEYPLAWQANLHRETTNGTPTWFSGKDGFFGIDAAAGDDRNERFFDDAINNIIHHKLMPYGKNPTVQQLVLRGQKARLVIPSDDQPAAMNQQSVLVVQYPNSITIAGNSFNFFVLYADKNHIHSIINTLQFTAPSIPPMPIPQR